MPFQQRILSLIVLACMALPSWAVLPAYDGSGQAVPSLAPLLKRINPSVVNVSTFTTRSVQNPMLNDPFFRRFFNVPPEQRQPQKRRTQSAGSGVILDAKKGIVVTNHHVIDGADEIHIGLEDGRSFKAELIGSDPEVDIAVVKISPENLVDIRVADSEVVEIGDFVIAIGNPFGLGQTVTTGVVSALGRSGLGIEGYENFIQTDASINPGNSGGALVNLRGELVGINTAILAPSGGNVGIGFAIPSNMAKSSIDQILEHGEVTRGQLGVIIQDLTPDMAEAFEIDKQQRGVLIAEVQKGSAAAKAGIKVGDVVVSVDGKVVKTSAQLRNQIGLRRVGEKIRVKVLRNGKTQTLRVKIQAAQKLAQSGKFHKFLEGASLTNNSAGAGVIVEGITSGSAAANTGLRPGDIIVQVNKKTVSNLAEFKQVAKSSGKRLLLRVLRGEAALFILLR